MGKQKFKVGDVVKIKDSVTEKDLTLVCLHDCFRGDYPDGVFTIGEVLVPCEDGICWLRAEYSGWNVPEDFVELYVEKEDETALLKERVILLEERITYLESVLRNIGDKAHYASTGPTVVDEYWEIREMAYDAYNGE